MPGDVTGVDQNSDVMTMVTNRLEEYTASKERDLKGLDIDIGIPFPPGPISNEVGDHSAEQAVKIIKEKCRARESAIGQRGRVKKRTVRRREAIQSTATSCKKKSCFPRVVL